MEKGTITLRKGGYIDPVDLEEFLAGREAVYILRVRGDGFDDQRVRDGDLLVVQPRHVAQKGQRVIASVPGGNATLAIAEEDGQAVLGIVILMLRTLRSEAA